MLKILQARLQQYMNEELPDVQNRFRKSKGTRDQIVNICWIIGKAREFQETSTYASLTMLKPLIVWITKKSWKTLKEMGISDYITYLLRIGMQVKKQELEPDMKQLTGSKFGKESVKTHIVTCLFNLYAEHIMRNAGLDDSQAGIKIAGRNINNLRYAEDTIQKAESKEELKNLLMRVKEESEKTGLKLNFQKTKVMASGPITSRQMDGGKMETVTDFLFLGSKITVDGDCSHEIKRYFLLGRKVMTNLDCILKSRDIPLLTNVHMVKAMVFPLSMYGLESWTIKKAECWGTDAFELWCWRRLLRVSWTTRRSNQSILKEINTEYSLEGLLLKLKLQYFCHLMWRVDSLEKTLMLGKIEGRRTRRWQKMRWLDGITNLMDMSLSKLWEIVKDRETWHGVTKSQARLIDWTTTKFHPPPYNWLKFITFYGWLIFHCIYASHLSYPFFSWWTSRLLSCLGYCKPCCNEHWDSCVVLIFFFRVYLQ